jgi:hypothetical protein
MIAEYEWLVLVAEQSQYRDRQDYYERADGIRRLIARYLAEIANPYHYHIVWSEEDGEWVGLCDEFPSLSWLARTKGDALAGIQRLVDNLD